MLAEIPIAKPGENEAVLWFWLAQAREQRDILLAALRGVDSKEARDAIEEAFKVACRRMPR
jgi:hypothetical protein